LELLHSYVSGPTSVPYMGGHQYYVILIYDYFRRTWIYFMKTKNKVFSRFMEFKALVEIQTWKKIKVLSSKNGGEYTLNEFKNFCNKARIKRKTSIP